MNGKNGGGLTVDSLRAAGVEGGTICPEIGGASASMCGVVTWCVNKMDEV